MIHKLICGSCVILNSGCALLAGQAGLAQNVIQMAQVADYAKSTADAVSYLETGRSVVDNVVSKAVGKDCQMVRMLDGGYCVEPQED